MKTKTTKAVAFTQMTAQEQALISQIQSGIKQCVAIEKQSKTAAINVGLDFIRLKPICDNDRNKYSVILPGNSQPKAVSRFEAVYNSIGIARATAYRYIRAGEEHLMEINPVPQSVKDEVIRTGVMPNTNGKIDGDDENEALASAYLDEIVLPAFTDNKTPGAPTPLQIMSIIANACKRLKEMPKTKLEIFASKFSKLLIDAETEGVLDMPGTSDTIRKLLTPKITEVLYASLEEAIAASYGTPGAKVTREKSPIYNSPSLGPVPIDALGCMGLDAEIQEARTPHIVIKDAEEKK